MSRRTALAAIASSAVVAAMPVVDAAPAALIVPAKIQDPHAQLLEQWRQTKRSWEYASNRKDELYFAIPAEIRDEWETLSNWLSNFDEAKARAVSEARRLFSEAHAELSASQFEDKRQTTETRLRELDSRPDVIAYLDAMEAEEPLSKKADELRDEICETPARTLAGAVALARAWIEFEALEDLDGDPDRNLVRVIRNNLATGLARLAGEPLPYDATAEGAEKADVNHPSFSAAAWIDAADREGLEPIAMITGAGARRLCYRVTHTPADELLAPISPTATREILDELIARGRVQRPTAIAYASAAE